MLLHRLSHLRPMLPAIVLSACVLAPAVSHATLITFDDLNCPTSTAIPAIYAGLTWSNFSCLDGPAYVTPNSGYANGVVSGKNVAYNSFADPANFSITSPGTFTLNSAYLTAAWNNNLNLQVQAYRSGTLVSTTNHTLQPTGPLLVNFNLVNVDQIVFTSSGGVDAGIGGGGEHFVMDNLVVNEAVGPVTPPTPVPTLSQWGLMLLSGLLGVAMLGMRRRQG